MSHQTCNHKTAGRVQVQIQSGLPDDSLSEKRYPYCIVLAGPRDHFKGDLNNLQGFEIHTQLKSG